MKINIRSNRFDLKVTDKPNSILDKQKSKAFCKQVNNLMKSKSVKLLPNKEEKNLSKTKRTMSSNQNLSIKYCPRIHDLKTYKKVFILFYFKWESIKGIIWSDLNPNKRDEANREISNLLKTNSL